MMFPFEAFAPVAAGLGMLANAGWIVTDESHQLNREIERQRSSAN